MDNTILAIYAHELQNHVRHVQAGFEILNRGLQAGAPGEVLYGGQMLLVPASQLSALLWPTRARARKRGEALRKVLQLPEKHPLNDRRLSEIWERGDEKMEEWIANTKHKRIVFDLVGDPFAVAGEGEEPVEEGSVFRCYDPERKIFYYRGVPFNIDALGRSLADVANRILSVYYQMFPDAQKQDEENQKRRAEAAEAARAQATDTANKLAELEALKKGESGDAGIPTVGEVAAPAAAEKPKPKRRRSPAKAEAAADADEKPKPKRRAPRRKKPEEASKADAGTSED